MGIWWSGGLFFDFGRFDDFRESPRVEAGTSDESAINVRLAEELDGVGGFDAAAVLDADALGEVGGSEFGEDAADRGVGGLGLFGRGGASGADGPDRFVSDDEIIEVLEAVSREGTFELGLQNFVFLAGLAFFERFADAKDGAEFIFDGRAELFVNEGVGFAEELSAFAMTDDDVADKKLAKHLCADFTGVGTGSFEIKVLGAEFDLLSFGNETFKFAEGGEGWGDDDFGVWGFADFEVEHFPETLGFGEGHVHFPVRGDNGFSHRRRAE